MTLGRVDYDHLRQNPSQADRRILLRLAREQGWSIDKKSAKGSHYSAKKTGRRSVTIPQKPRPGTVRSIIDDLTREA